MTKRDDAATVEAALGGLLLRSNRSHLYATLAGSSGVVDETTYPVLSGLARVGTATATELAEAIGLDRTVTTRYASRLVEAGLVERRAHPTDARATALRLTARGRRTVTTMRGRLQDVIADAMSSWSAAQCHTFAQSLTELADALSPQAE